ncbi:MAG: hypothetical protein J0H54_12010, partial [Rhizobiales bacterium]|nr:hypothetical protein [Hyphomicrobiales bacterium]
MTGQERSAGIAAAGAHSAAADAGFAPAKINLALHVIGRRDDGYHEIDSLVLFAGIGDRLQARPHAGGRRLMIDGPFAAGLSDGDDNLVLRALAAFEAAIAPLPQLG